MYKSGFARSQEAYDAAVTALFSALERVSTCKTSKITWKHSPTLIKTVFQKSKT